MQNKLASMTQAQRGKTAVAMLVTGMYLDDENLIIGYEFVNLGKMMDFIKNFWRISGMVSLSWWLSVIRPSSLFSWRQEFAVRN